MKEIKESLNQAYAILSTIPVAGDNADKMTAARAELRRAFSMLDKFDGKTEGADGRQ